MNWRPDLAENGEAGVLVAVADEEGMNRVGVDSGDAGLEARGGEGGSAGASPSRAGEPVRRPGWRRRWHGDVRTLRAYRMVLRRAEYLPTADQNLLRLALEGQHGFRQLGTLFGRSAGETCRRVKRLLQRLRDPVVAALIDFPVDLPEEHRAIGLAHLVQGRPLRELAKEMRLSEGEARSMIVYIKGWARMAQRVWVAESVKRSEEKGAAD